MLTVLPKDYDSLKDYAKATVATYLQDREKDITSMTEWGNIVDYYDRDMDWEATLNEFMKVFNVDNREELKDVYQAFKYELNEKVAELVHNSNTTDLKQILTGNFIVDMRYGWSFDETDPLILDEYNQGIVARYGLIEAMRAIKCDITNGQFAVPYDE